MTRSIVWRGLSAVATGSAVVACSLLTELDGLSGPPGAATQDAGERVDAGGDATSSGDAAPDASVLCRPGFTGETCTTACRYRGPEGFRSS